MRTQSVVIQQPVQAQRIEKGVFIRLRGRGALSGITYEGVVKFFRRGGFGITTVEGAEIVKYQGDSFSVEPVSQASADFIRERRGNS